MAFTLDTLAQELGIDPETLKSKADVVAKWNGYLTEADTQYRGAKQLKEEAEAKLAAVEAEQKVINDNIAAFGMTEANVAALRANNAAMEASLKELQKQGFEVKIPDPVTTPTKTEPAFDPNAFRNDVNSSLIHGFNAMNRYQRLFGTAMPDDIDQLAREAGANRKPFDQYVAEKYGFAAQEKKLADERTAKQQAEWKAQGAKEYAEAHPVTTNHPDLMRGVPSRHPEIARERTAPDAKFANLSTREKIAKSVGSTMKVLNKAS